MLQPRADAHEGACCDVRETYCVGAHTASALGCNQQRIPVRSQVQVKDTASTGTPAALNGKAAQLASSHRTTRAGTLPVLLHLATETEARLHPCNEDTSTGSTIEVTPLAGSCKVQHLPHTLPAKLWSHELWQEDNIAFAWFTNVSRYCAHVCCPSRGRSGISSAMSLAGEDVMILLLLLLSR